MAYLKFQNGVQITRHISFHEEQTRILITQTTLDGREHLTRFGSPSRDLKADVYVTGSGKAALEDAADALSPLEVSGKNGTFHAIVKSLGAFSRMAGGYFHTSVTFAITSEVVDE